MKEQLIKEITDEVVRYVPEIMCGRCEEGNFCYWNNNTDECDWGECPNKCNGQPRDITLEDILIAVVEKQGKIHINLIRKWELGKTANEQSVETLHFIRDILK